MRQAKGSTSIASPPQIHLTSLIASQMSLPPVKWAQRKDSLYVTIMVPDIVNPEVALTENSIVFK